MSNSTNNKQQKSLSIQLPVEENRNSSNSTEIIHREKIEHTPFEIVITDKYIFISMGKYRLSEEWNREELQTKSDYTEDWQQLGKTLLKIEHYDIILRMIGVCQELDDIRRAEEAKQWLAQHAKEERIKIENK